MKSYQTLIHTRLTVKLDDSLSQRIAFFMRAKVNTTQREICLAVLIASLSWLKFPDYFKQIKKIINLF